MLLQLKEYIRVALLCLTLLIANSLSAQLFPNPATLSTGQGAPGTIDPIWLASSFWYATNPPNPMGLTYISTLINNNCAPGAWVDPASLPAPVNNGNWITGSDDDCATNTNAGYRYFRLTLNLPPDCNGFSVTVPGNYILNLVGYADNSIADVFVNGVSSGINGGGFSIGTQLNIALTGPWVAGVNFVDVLVFNSPSNPGDINPYGLLLVADANATDLMDTDGDGVSNLNDLCPCDFGTNPYGCADPTLHNCDIDLIRQTFTNAGCIEMPGCSDDCSIYFLNPQAMTGAAAQNFAQSLGANLVSIQSMTENDCVLSGLTNLGLPPSEVVWIGFSDETIEGTFEWYDQSPVTFTNWAPGEPNNSGGDEDCVQIYPDGSWNDLACSSANSKSIIEVNLCPVANLSADQIICLGETIDVSVTQTLFGSSPYSYLWNNGMTAPLIFVTPTATEEFTVSITDAYSCEAFDTMLVTVLVPPTAFFTADTVCQGVATQFANTSSVSGGNTIVSSNWIFGDGATSTLTNPTHAYTTAGLFNVTLIVTTSNGCSDTIVQSVPVLENPLANFTGVNNCLGESTDFMNTSTPIGIIASSVWDFADGASSTNQNATHSYSNSGTYNVQLTVTANNGCQNSVSQLIVISPKPSASFTSSDVCLGTNTIFTNASSVALPDVITNWDWVFGDNSISNLENPTHLFTADDSYSSQLIVTTNNGCSDTVNVSHFVWPLPAIDFTFNNACVQATTNFNNTTVISSLNTPNTMSTWLWDFSDGTTANTENALHIYANSGSYTVNLQGTSSNGCVNNLQQLVTVYPKPIANYMVDEVCFNLANNFTDLSTIGVGGTINSWAWNFGDNTTSALQNPTHTYSSENIYTTQLIVESADGCADTASFQATVYPLPIVDFDATNVCFEFSNQFAANTSISNLHTSNSIISLNYNFSDGTNSSLANVSHLYQNDGVYNVSLTATSNNGCVDSIQKPVIVYPKPTASFTGTNLSGCSPICPVITSNSTINQSGIIANYMWSYTDGFTDHGLFTTRCFENISAMTESFGVTLIVESEWGCKDTLVSSLDYISVYHLPVANFNFSPSEPDLTNNLIQFENLSSNASSYSWAIPGVFTSTMMNPTAEVPYAPGTYQIQLIASTLENCRDTMVKMITIKDEVVVYVPNTFTPDSDNFNPTFNPVIGAGVDLYNYSFYIYNRWGEMVFESHDASIGWDGTYGGKLVHSDMFTWELNFKVKASDEKKRMVGHLNLLR